MSLNGEERINGEEITDLSGLGLSYVPGVSVEDLLGDVPSLANLHAGNFKVNLKDCAGKPQKGNLNTYKRWGDFWKISKGLSPIVISVSLLAGITAGFIPEVLNWVVNSVPVLSNILTDGSLFGGLSSLALISYCTPYFSGKVTEFSKNKFNLLLACVEKASKEMEEALGYLANKFELGDLFEKGAKITVCETSLVGTPGKRPLGGEEKAPVQDATILKIESLEPADENDVQRKKLYLICASEELKENSKGTQKPVLYGFVHSDSFCPVEGTLMGQIIKAADSAENNESYVVGARVDVGGLREQCVPRYARVKK